MAPNEHEFHESDQKFLAPGAATSSNNALQRGWFVSNRWAVAVAAHDSHFHPWMMCASTWRLLRKWPRMNTNFTN